MAPKINKNYKAAIILPVLLMILCSTLPASIFKSDDRVFISKRDSLIDDLYILAAESVMDGFVANDILVAGFRQSTSGVVGGSLLSFSFNSIIRGNIQNSANVFAYKLIIDGEIANNLMAFANEIDISPSSRIGKDANLRATEISVAGAVDRDLNIEAKRVIISGRIGGNLNITANEISISSPAEILGDIWYESPNEMLIDDDVTMSGEINWKKVSRKITDETGEIVWPVRVFLMLCAFLTGLIIIPTFNKHTKVSAMQIVKKPLVCLGVGFMAFCLAPVAMILLVITLIGLPAAVLLLFIYAILFYIAKIYVSIALGWLIVRGFRKGVNPRQGWSLLVGLVILMLAFALPMPLALILYLIVIFFGFGAVILGFNECRIMTGNDSKSEPAAVDQNQ